MSRKSHAFADGQPAFSWRVGKETDPSGTEHYRATCKNHPAVTATGPTEQIAILAARKLMEVAVDKDDNAMLGPGQR